jgi:SAM-dependent methyltransferase
MAHRARPSIRLISKILKGMLDEHTTEKLRYIREVHEVFSNKLIRECPICRYNGYFRSFGQENRPEAMCPQCKSLERHRLLYLALTQHEQYMLIGKDVLHFAPEECIRDLARRASKTYITADLLPRDVDIALDITNICIPSNAFDIVICNHVIDQIPNDIAALRELYRILRLQGLALITVTIVEGWEHTFEDPEIHSRENRRRYFGLEDRCHYYGRDFSTRIEAAGFVVDVFQPEFRCYSHYGLTAGDKIFICRKHEPTDVSHHLEI